MAEEKYPAGMRDEDGDLLSSSERAAMRDSEIKIPDDDAETDSSSNDSGSGQDNDSSSSDSNSEDSILDEAEETRVDIQKTEDDILAKYKDDKRYKIDPDELTDQQKKAIDYNEPERSVGDPNIILTGQELESRLTEGMSEKVNKLDNFIDQAEKRQKKSRNDSKNTSTQESFEPNPLFKDLQPVNNTRSGYTRTQTYSEMQNQGREPSDFNPGEATLRTGVNVMQFGQNRLAEPVESFFDRFDQPRLGAAPVQSGQPTQNEIAGQIEEDRERRQALEGQIGQGDDLIGSAAGGTATLGTQLGGLAVATPGAVATSFREDTPGLGESAASGPGLVAEEASENPGDFVASEAGEEAGEAAAFGAATGGLGIAAAAVPTPEFEVTPETSNPSEGFTSEETVSSDEESFASLEREFQEIENEDLPQLQDQSLEREPEAPLIEDEISGLQGDNRIGQEPGQGNAPLENEQGLTIGDIEALAGREITPAERAEIEARLQQEDFQRVGNVREVVRSAIEDPNALGSGPGALVPPETTEPDVEFEQEFVENDLRVDPSLGQEPESDSSLDVFQERPQNSQRSGQGEPDLGFESEFETDLRGATGLEPGLDEDQGQPLDNPPAEDQVPVEEQPLDFDEEFQEPDFFGPDPGIRGPDPSVDFPNTGGPQPQPEPDPEPGPDGRGSRDFDIGGETQFSFSDQDAIREEEELGQRFEFAPSLTGEVLDIEAAEGVDDDTVFTGLEIRGVQEPDSDNL